MTDRYSCKPLQSVNILGETFAKLPFLLQQLQKIVPCSMLPIMSIFFYLQQSWADTNDFEFSRL